MGKNFPMSGLLGCCFLLFHCNAGCGLPTTVTWVNFAIQPADIAKGLQNNWQPNSPPVFRNTNMWKTKIMSPGDQTVIVFLKTEDITQEYQGRI